MISTSVRAALIISGSIGLSIAAKATLILVLGFVGASAARRVRASLRHLWWASIFGALLALPSVALLMPALVIPVGAAPNALPTRVASLEISPPTVASGRLPVVSADSEVRPAPFLSTATWIAVGWFLGASLTLMPIASGLGRLRAIRRTGRPWSASVSNAGPVPLLLHDAIVVPMTFGFRRPIVALPSDALSWSKGDLCRALA